ncbi:hypothetical protein [Rhizobium leguminosarum]|uniref:hypothetical protein n=1 Tax=Rhizobium leguminosarum TaxID=384 RepID=UPI00101074CE|nr:hypothetical protein [Rhizobium leguminosarum]
MGDPASHDIATGQYLLEFKTGALVENIDRADGEVDLVDMRRGMPIYRGWLPTSCRGNGDRQAGPVSHLCCGSSAMSAP